MKHTQGPWECIEAKDEHGDRTISIRGSGEFIASMDLVSIDGGAFRLPERGRANANLISLAPEMLEALGDLVELCEETAKAEGWSNDFVGDILAAANLARAKAILKKARGA